MGIRMASTVYGTVYVPKSFLFGMKIVGGGAGLGWGGCI